MWDTLKSEASNMSKLEYATITADIAGIFDPSPVSDGVGFVLSAAQGDALGALLSLGSMIPYLGDAAAKPLKIAKRAPKTAKILKAILKKSDKLAGASKAVLKESGLTINQIAAARKKALKRVQQAMLDAKKKLPNCEDCKKLVDASGNKKGTLHMPTGKTGGKWKTPDGKQPTDGNGLFEFTEAKTLPDGRTVKQIEYRNGTPNFDDYVEGQKYELWEVSGNATTDAKSIKKMMSDSGLEWKPPNKNKFVLHHFEDGTVGYIPRSIHDVGQQGVAHSGGNSMINNQLF